MTQVTRCGEARWGTMQQCAEWMLKWTDIGTTGDEGMTEEMKGARRDLSGVSKKEYEQHQTKPKTGLGEYFLQVQCRRWLSRGTVQLAGKYLVLISTNSQVIYDNYQNQSNYQELPGLWRRDFS